MKFRFIDDVGRVWHRLWTVRIALGWGAVCGVAMCWGAFEKTVPLSVFAGVCVVVNVALAYARVTKQPGLEK